MTKLAFFSGCAFIAWASFNIGKRVESKNSGQSHPWRYYAMTVLCAAIDIVIAANTVSALS